VQYTDEQKADLQKYIGQLTMQSFDKLASGKDTTVFNGKRVKFTDLPEDTLLKVMSNILDDVGEQGRQYMAQKLKLKKSTTLKAPTTPKFQLPKLMQK